MVGNSAGRYPPTEQVHWSSSKRSRISQHDVGQHNSTKKQRVTIKQTETRTETLTVNHTSTSYAHSYANSHTYFYDRRTGQRPKGKGKRASAEDKRKWVCSTHIVSPDQDRVVFMSYNILGVKNAADHEDLYQNVCPKHLDWDYRKRLIHKEIRECNPGIICFQEVDCYDDLDCLLQKDGFKGVYQGRTGDACDGCAIFWNKELFDLLHEESIEFQKFDLRNNVCQLCVFKMKVKNVGNDTSASHSETVSSRSFLVGNIHVLFNPKRGDLKLGQARLFLESAYRLSLEWGDIPVVLAGDLNSMPQSAMYQFLTSSKLDIQMHDRKQISGQTTPLEYRSFKSRSVYRWSDEELRLATGTGATHLIHQLRLRSAYAGVPGNSRTRDSCGEPLATSYHSNFMGTVDYIWHTTEFVPVRVLDTLPIDILTRTGGLPSKKWGSDHLSLVCELAFTDEGSET